MSKKTINKTRVLSGECSIPELDRRPISAEILLGSTSIDNFEYSKGNVSGKNYKTYFLNERIGLDQCRFRLQPESIDEAKLEKARKDGNAEYSIISDNDKASNGLTFKNCKNKYSTITLKISKYATITLKKNNIKNARGGNKSDIFLLKILVKPNNNFEELGNIRNYSYTEMLCEIMNALTKAEEFGIKFNREKILIAYIEINLTAVMNCKFESLKILKYFMSHCKPYYTNNEYSHSGTKSYKTNRTTTKAKTNELIGFDSYSKSKTVKIYDKGYETSESYNNTTKEKIEFDFDDASLVRVEFTLKNDIAITNLLKTNNFWELSDKKIQDAFLKLSNDFFIKAFNNYLSETEALLKNLVKNIITRNNKGWKIELLNGINKVKTDFNEKLIYLGEADINYIIDQNDIFSKNPSYYKPVLEQIFNKDSNINYNIFANFFAKFCHCKTCSSKRIIRYKFSTKHK